MWKSPINANGKLFRRDQCENEPGSRVSLFDRGFLYGDSLYEVWRTYGGKVYGLEDHLDRLEKSAKLMRMQITQPRDIYRKEILRTLEEFKKVFPDEEAYIRLVVTRGEGKIGFGLNCIESPSQYFIITQPLQEPTPVQLRRGLYLRIVSRLRNDVRALNPAMKTGNYLNSLLAYLEAMPSFDDALMCNAEGHLTEGTTFNIGYIRRGILATPPLDVGILEGITRKKIITLARDLGIQVREVRFPAERLYEANEVFALSTLKEIFPITRINDQVIGDGKPGPITTRLRDAFQKAARKEVEL